MQAEEEEEGKAEAEVRRRRAGRQAVEDQKGRAPARQRGSTVAAGLAK